MPFKYKEPSLDDIMLKNKKNLSPIEYATRILGIALNETQKEMLSSGNGRIINFDINDETEEFSINPKIGDLFTINNGAQIYKCYKYDESTMNCVWCMINNDYRKYFGCSDGGISTTFRKITN